MFPFKCIQVIICHGCHHPLFRSHLLQPLIVSSAPKQDVDETYIFWKSMCTKYEFVGECVRYGMENNSTCCRSSQTRPSHRRARQASEPWSALTRSAVCTSWGRAWKTCV